MQQTVQLKCYMYHLEHQVLPSSTLSIIIFILFLLYNLQEKCMSLSKFHH